MALTEEAFNLAFELADAIQTNDELQSFFSEDLCLDQNNWGYDAEYVLRNFFCGLYDSQIRTRCGATKGVIICDALPFVVKIPFTANYNEASNGGCDCYVDCSVLVSNTRDCGFCSKCEACSCMYSSCGYERQYFDGTFEKYNQARSWDYCEREENIFMDAMKQHLGYAFAEEHLLTFIAGYPVYIQEKVDMSASARNLDSSEEEQKESKEVEEFLSKNDIYAPGFDGTWAGLFISFYGIKELERLNEFIEEFHITDLHLENIGYINNRPILFDYAGFF